MMHITIHFARNFVSGVFCAIALGGGISRQALAQQEDSCQSLQQVMAAAVEHSPRVSEAESRREGALAELRTARSLNRLQLSSFARTGIGDSGLVDSAIENQIGLRASRRLIDFGDSRFASDAATASVTASESDIALSRERIALQAALNALDMLEREDQLEIISDKIEYLERFNQVAEQTLLAGGMTRSDVAEIGSRLATAQAEHMEIDFQRQRLLTDLTVSTGQPINLCRQSADPDSLVEQLSSRQRSTIEPELSLHPEVAAARSEVYRLEALYRRERRNRLPVIELVAIASYSHDDTTDRWSYRDRVGIDVSVPLLTGSALGAERASARAELHRAQSELADLIQRRNAELEVSRLRLLSLSAQYIRLEQGLTLRRAQFDAAHAEFEAGLKTMPELIEDFLELERIRINFTSIKHTLLREDWQLRFISGTSLLEEAGDVSDVAQLAAP